MGDILINLTNAQFPILNSYPRGQTASRRLLFVAFIWRAGTARIGAKQHLSAIGEGEIPRASSRRSILRLKAVNDDLDPKRNRIFRKATPE
jgi:hypothetical protein